MHTHVRLILADVRPDPASRPMPVAYRVLDPQRREFQAGQWRARRRHVDAQGAIGAKPFWPVEIERELVDVLFVAVRAVTDLLQDTAGEAAFEVGTVSESYRTAKGDAAFSRGNFVGAEIRKLGGEHAFQASRTGREETFHQSDLARTA